MPSLDFTDTAHLALKVLIEKDENGDIVPTQAAREYQDYFEEIAIDEYQDSNEIQELLLSSVSRESRGVYNRFMVGDVKQSIYRFRMSDPGIFMKKYESYGRCSGRGRCTAAAPPAANRSAQELPLQERGA